MLIDNLGPFLIPLSIAALVLALALVALLVIVVRRAQARALEKEKEAAVSVAVAEAKADPDATATEPGADLGADLGAAPLPATPPPFLAADTQAAGPAPMAPTADRRKPSVAAKASDKPLRASFRAAMKALSRHVTGRDYRHKVPWIVMIGEAASGKTSALGGVGLELPLGRPAEDAGGTDRPCNWWFFEQGLVLDLSGDMILRADGRTSDEKTFAATLRQLQWARPERPLDSVVVAIPASDLIGDNMPSPELISVKADILARKLWQMQTELGLLFPIYIVVTKCDRVPGFKSFFGTLPPQRLGQMFGWANPLPPDTPYSPEWPGQAFSEMQTGLFDMQLLQAAAPDAAERMDAAFLFPGNFGKLKQPIGRYLDRLFGKSAYHESFSLRGIWFTGDLEADASRPAAAQPAAAQPAAAVPDPDLFGAPQASLGLTRAKPAGRHPILLTDLFRRKLFAEHGIAGPARPSLISRNRAVRTLQGSLAASLVIGILGLGISYNNLIDDASSLGRVLADVGGDIDRLSKSRGQRQQPDEEDKTEEKVLAENKRESTERLLVAMAQIKTNTLKAAFMPTSWFSNIDHRVSDYISFGFEHIVMRAMYEQLADRTRELLGGTDAGAGARLLEENALGQLEELPEFQALSGFMVKLRELGRHIDLYDELGNSSDIGGIGELTRYLFNFELPKGFFTYTEFYAEAVERAKDLKFDVATYTGKATSHVRELAWNLYARVFRSGALAKQLHALTLRLREVETASTDSDDEAENLRRLLQAIDGVRETLQSPLVAAVAGDSMNLGLDFTKVLANIGQSRFLGPALTLELARQGQTEFDQFKLKIGAYRAQLTGPVLAREGGRVRLRLADSLEAIRQGGHALFGKPFMAIRLSNQIATNISPSQRLRWNTSALDQAIRFYQEFDQFAADPLNLFPPALQSRVRDLALARLGVNMETAIANAQMITTAGANDERSEDALAREVRDFSRASDRLVTLLNVLQAQGLNATYDALTRVAKRHASAMLARVDGLLTEDGLYLPVEPVANWRGLQAPVVRSFQARDDTEVQHFLDLQRQRLDLLSREYAGPLLGFLGQGHFSADRAGSPVLSKWRRISSELSKYNNRQPGSALVGLEKFIRYDMAETNRDNCTTKMAAGRRADGDFFNARRESLRRALLAQCVTLATGSAGGLYAGLSDLFNRSLAGRYPFASPAPGQPVDDADADAVRNFFKVFAKDEKIIRGQLTADPAIAKAVSQPLLFLDRMAAVGQFLAPVLNVDEKDPEAIYDVTADFRVNRAFEIGGNQVIEWSLDLGNRRIRRTDAQQTGFWKIGEPVRVVLRWAKDSPRLPLPTGTGLERIEGGLNVIFEASGTWSLIRLMRDHAGQASDFVKGTDALPNTLRFVVANSAPRQWLNPDAPAAAAGRAENQTRVYIRFLMATRPKEKQPAQRLALPLFPLRAPALGALPVQVTN